jgi:PAS domain S-box-containing protein
MRTDDIKGCAWLDAVATAALILQQDKIVYANSAAESLTGYPRETLAEMHYTRQSYGDAQTDNEGIFDLTLLSSSGEVTTLTAALSPIEFDGQSAALATVVGRQSPGISLATFRQVMDSSSEMFFYLRPERNASGEIVDIICEDMNRLAESRLSRGRELVVGAPLSRFLTPEQRQLVFEFAPYIFDSGEPFDHEIEVHDSDGISRWFQVEAVALADRLAVFAREVTERKALEEQVRANEALYRALVNNLPDATILVYDLDLRYLVASGSLLEPMGYPPQDIVGKTAWETLQEPEKLVPYYHAALEGTTQTFEWVFGERLYFTRIVPIKHDDGTVFAGMVVIQDVTERTRLQNDLLESEQRLRTMLEHMPVMIDALDENYVPLVWNRECERVTGYSASEILGNPHMLEMLYPNANERESIMAEWRRRGNTYHDWECQITAKDGSAKTIAWSSIADDVPIKGWPNWAIGVDVTERKRVENALRESEERYRITSELISDYAYSYLVDADGMIHHEWITDSFTRVTGYTFEEIDAKGSYALYHPDEEARVLRDLEVVMRGESISSEYRIITKSGEMRWLLIERRPVWDEEQQRVVRFFGVAQDITARKKHEEEMLRSEARYRAVFEGANMGIIIVNKAGYPVRVNTAAVQLLGYVPEEFLRMPFTAFTYKDDVENNLELFNGLISGQLSHYRYEKRYVHKDGSLIWVRLHVSPFPSSANGEDMIIALIDDITQQKQIETQALELAVEREKVKMLANFVRDVSHDLKTPLSILTTHLYLLPKNIDPQVQAQRIQEMNEQVVHLGLLIDQLLTMTRLDIAYEFVYEPVKMSLLMESAARSVRTEIANRGLELVLDLDEGLPEAAVDEARMNQAIDNLIDNAMQFTPQGGTITLRTYMESERVVVEVKDTGSGIAPEDLPHIFDRFYRGDKARTQITGGAGLGLSIAQRIVELHGSTIEVDTEVDRGSTFRIRLPIYRGH